MVNETDISICDYSTVLNNHGLEKRGTLELELSNIECLESMYHPKIHGMEFVAWGKLYKTTLFKKKNIEYPVGKIHEDIFTTYKLIYAASKIAYSNYIGYFYRIRKDSIMTSDFNLKRLDVLDARAGACDFFLGKGEINAFELALNAYLRDFIILYSELSECKADFNLNKEKKRLMQRYNAAFKKYIKMSNMDIKHRMFYKMFAVVPSKLYRKILR